MEIILDNTNPTTSLQDAINSININNNGVGTVTIRRDVPVSSSIDVPVATTLNFYTGNKLIVTGSPTINIYGQIHTELNQIFQISINHTLKIHNQPLSPEWFGYCSYQDNTVTNDQPIIQKTMNALVPGGEIIFKGNEYLFESPVVVSVSSISIKGKGTYSSAQDTNNLKMTEKNVDGIFNITTPGARIRHLNFEGVKYGEKGIDAKGIAIKFVRDNKSKNIDAEIIHCSFLHFRICIYGEGANLRILDNLITQSYIGVRIKEAHGLGPDDYSNIASTRGHIISRNRFHSIGSYLTHSSLVGSTCIKLIHEEGYTVPQHSYGESYTMRGYYNHITDNYADDCKTFFEGSLDRTKIDGNSILSSGGTAIKANAGLYGAITNNLIDGSFTSNPHKLYPATEELSENAFPDGHGIHVNYCNYLTIHSNQINNKRFHGIYIQRSRYTSIQSNTITNFNRHRFIKSSGKPPKINDEQIYDGIHIQKHQEPYNIYNMISDNRIYINHLKVEGRYGIYIGEENGLDPHGNPYLFMSDNYITPLRMLQGVFIEP